MFKDVDFVKKRIIWCNAFDVNNHFCFDLKVHNPRSFQFLTYNLAYNSFIIIPIIALILLASPPWAKVSLQYYGKSMWQKILMQPQQYWFRYND